MSGTIGDARKRNELLLLDTGPVTLVEDPLLPSLLEVAAEVCKAAGYRVLMFGGLTSMEREEIDSLKVAEL